MLFEVSGGAWEIPKLRALLEEIVPRNSFFNDFEVTHDVPHLGRRTMLLNARRLDLDDGSPRMILLAIEDVTERQHADAAIASLAAIVNSSDDAIIGTDLNGVITSWNHSAERLYSYAAQEAVGRPITMLIPPDRRHEEADILARLKRGEPVDHFETVRVRKNRSPVDISLTVSPIKDATGQVIGASKIARDITERKRVEEALRQSQTRYQVLIQASAQIVWTTDAGGAVVEDSPSWRAFTGQTYEQWKGFGWLDVLHPDDRERVSELWQRAVEERTPVDTAYRLRHTSGAWRWTAVRALPVLNPDGSVREWVGMNRDFTERKQAEEALRENEERFRTLFASAPMAVFVCDRNAVIQQYNRRAVELWGREPACGVEQHCGSVKLWLPNGTLLPHAHSPIVDVLRTGIPALNVEVFIERPDGSRLPVLVNFAALKNAEGDTTGAITSFIDITERKQAEEEISRLLAETRQRERELREKQEQLVQAAKLASIGELATGVAHELNNPLNNIGLFVGNLIDQLAVHEIDASRVSADLHKILTQVSRAAKIIAQVRTFGRAAGADHQRLVMHELIQSAVDLVQEQFRLENIEITLNLDRSNPMVLGNRLQLEQVFLNLLTNARDAMENGTEKSLSISTAVRSEKVYVHFADTGMGIPADVLPRIFDPFFTTKEVGQGTGLGLSIGYSIIKEHHGTITADSRLGTGATLVIELPLARKGDEYNQSSDR